MAIEPDLLYPLLRGRDVNRWHAEPSAHILVTHLPGMRLNAIPEDEMKIDYPKTYLYLKRFEAILRERAAYKRYFRPDDPFYSMFNVGDYTFTPPHKVVWPNIASQIVSAVISTEENKLILPQHIVTLVACQLLAEAHYICALMNSRIVNFSLQSYSMKGGKSFGDPHVLQNIRIPKFDSANKFHQELSGLSQNAHYAVTIGDEAGLRELEERIDELAAQIWGLSGEELAEIKSSLEEMA